MVLPVTQFISSNRTSDAVSSAETSSMTLGIGQEFISYIPQQASFYIAALMIVAYQASRFQEVKLNDEVVARYTSALGGVEPRDLAGPGSYGRGIFGFLSASLFIFYLLFMIPPNILLGVDKVFALHLPREHLENKELYAFYVAALFIGVSSQTIIVDVNKYLDKLRIYFQNRMGSPARLNRTIDACLSKIEEKSGRSTERLRRELDRLTDKNWKEFKEVADHRFFTDRLDKYLAGQKIGNIPRDRVMELAEAVLTIAAVSIIRHSGPEGLQVLVRRIGVDERGWERFNKPLGAFALSLLTLSLMLWVLVPTLDWLVTVRLAGLKSSEKGFWPDDVRYSMRDVLNTSMAAFIMLMYTVYLAGLNRHERSTGIVDEIEAAAPLIFRVCGVSLVVYSIIMFLSYSSGTGGPVESAMMPNILMAILLQALIPLGPSVALAFLFMRPNPSKWRLMVHLICGSLCVALASWAYAHVYLNYVLIPRWNATWSLDFFLYAIFLNTVVYGVATYAVYLYFNMNTRKETIVEGSPPSPRAAQVEKVHLG